MRKSEKKKVRGWDDEKVGGSRTECGGLWTESAGRRKWEVGMRKAEKKEGQKMGWGNL